MTIPGLHNSLDSVMEIVQKYPHSCLAACSPDSLLHSAYLHRLNLCHDSMNLEGRDDGIV